MDLPLFVAEKTKEKKKMEFLFCAFSYGFQKIEGWFEPSVYITLGSVKSQSSLFPFFSTNTQQSIV